MSDKIRYILPPIISAMAVFIFLLTVYSLALSFRGAVAFLLFNSAGYIWSYVLLRHQGITIIDATIIGAGVSLVFGPLVVWFLYQAGVPLKAIPVGMIYLCIIVVGLAINYFQTVKHR